MLRLEIVEWTEIVERDAVDANIAQLLAAEVTLSLDDFGAGYSTLILLSQLAIAEVKIEQALIATLSDAKSQSIVRFIVEVAHRCGAIVVAEGTETLAQEQKLRALGVDVGQGYLYSAALPGLVLHSGAMARSSSAWPLGSRSTATQPTTMSRSAKPSSARTCARVACRFSQGSPCSVMPQRGGVAMGGTMPMCSAAMPRSTSSRLTKSLTVMIRHRNGAAALPERCCLRCIDTADACAERAVQRLHLEDRHAPVGSALRTGQPQIARLPRREVQRFHIAQ